MKVGLVRPVTFENGSQAKYWARKWGRWCDSYFNQSRFNCVVERYIHDKGNHVYCGYLPGLIKIKSHNGIELGDRQVKWLTTKRATTLLFIYAQTRTKQSTQIAKQALMDMMDYAMQQGLVDTNVVKGIKINDFQTRELEYNPIPRLHMEHILEYCFSYFEYRNHGIAYLIAYDAKIPVKGDLTWDEVYDLDLTPETVLTLQQHQKDWGFQKYVTPKIQPVDMEYVPMDGNTLRARFTEICKRLGYDYTPSSLKQEEEDND